MDRRRTASLTGFATALVLAAPGHAALEGSDPAPCVVRLVGGHAALPGGAQDIRGNPALAAMGSNSWEGGAGVTRPLGLDGLVEQAGWVAWVPGPRAEASGALRAGWRGFAAADLYRDDAVFVAGAWRWKDLSVGVGGSGLRSDFGEGAIGSAFGGSAGAAFRWRDLVVGAFARDASIFHASPAWMAEPFEGSLGLALVPRSEPWRTAASATYREGVPWDWRLAQEVALPGGVDAGVGVGLEPFRLAGGLGWSLGWARLDAAVEGDPVLGWQTHVALGFAIR